MKHDSVIARRVAVIERSLVASLAPSSALGLIARRPGLPSTRL